MAGPKVLHRDHALKDIKPGEGRILVKLHGAPTTIALMNEEELEPEGEILAVGFYRLSDGSHAPLGVKVGDMILIGRAPVTPIKVDGAICYVLGASAVEAVVGLGTKLA